MTDSNKLIQSFQTTQWIIDKQTEGLSHEDSLLQLPFRSNCMNWVLGHIAHGRHRVLQALGETALLSEAEVALYERGSEPITGGGKAIPLPDLLERLKESQERITAVLQTTPPNTLAAIYDEERQLTVGDRVAGLHWHETYHVGQLEILRQLAGADDKVI